MLKAIATEVFSLAFGADLEQQFGAAAVEGHVAEFVDAEQVDAAVAGNSFAVRLMFVTDRLSRLDFDEACSVV